MGENLDYDVSLGVLTEGHLEELRLPQADLQLELGHLSQVVVNGADDHLHGAHQLVTHCPSLRFVSALLMMIKFQSFTLNKEVY